MEALIRGIHHITVCPAGAQEDVDFFTRVLGQRLVKQTVLMDGRIPIYHFYYGNANADVGSIATSFPYSRKPGRRGTGQLAATVYAVPSGATAFWVEHCDRLGVAHTGVLERFGCRYVRVQHPAGLLFDVMEWGPDGRSPWTTDDIGRDVATRGFAGAVMSVRDVPDQEQFLIEALGFRKVGVDGPYHRFELPHAATPQFVELLHEPERPAGSWGFGAGTAHHIAFEMDSDEALVRQKVLYEELGYTDASEIKDRYYFHSMYVRSPGGVLVECTSNVPGGFYQDESPEDLGTRLHLPPWYEEQHDAIVSRLEPLRLPAVNRPRPGAAPVVRQQARPGTQGTSPIQLSRTKPEFGDPPR